MGGKSASAKRLFKSRCGLRRESCAKGLPWLLRELRTLRLYRLRLGTTSKKQREALQSPALRFQIRLGVAAVKLVSLEVAPTSSTQPASSSGGLNQAFPLGHLA